MHDVFISYSFENKALADRICHHLEQNHVRCWYAPRDVSPGADFREAIMEAIQQSKRLVLIYTKASNQSRDVRNEITAAFKASCPILPFRIDDVQMEPSLAYYLNGVHWLDAVTPPMEKRIQELYETVVSIINKKAAPVHPKPKPKKKIWKWLLALLAVYAGIYMAGSFFGDRVPGKTNDFFLRNLEGIGPYRYSFFADVMFSPDGEMYFLENTENHTLTLVKTDTGDALLTDIDYPVERPESVTALVASSYDVVYFTENFLNDDGRTPVVKIFDRKENRWLCREGIPIRLTETQAIHTCLYSADNKAFRSDLPDALQLLIYDSAEGKECFTREITINPDGTVTERDISGFGMTRYLAGIKHSGVLMLDRTMALCVYDSQAGTVEKPSWEELRESYLPNVILNGDRVLSKDGRYLLQTEFANNTSTVTILDLEKREERYRETFAHNYNVFFQDDSRAIGYEFTNGEGSLFSIDLETGRQTRLLDSSYFRKQDAFQNVPFSFVYSEELDACIFVSETLPVKGKPTVAQVTIISEDGRILGESNEVEVPFQEGWLMPKAVNGKLFLFMVDNYPELSDNNGIQTTVFCALYNLNPDGTVEFLN